MKRVTTICEHNRTRSQCKQCGVGGICEHNRRRSVCNQYGGGGICERNLTRSQCKQCGGGGICEHNRIRRGDIRATKPKKSFECWEYIVDLEDNEQLY